MEYAYGSTAAYASLHREIYNLAFNVQELRRLRGLSPRTLPEYSFWVGSYHVVMKLRRLSATHHPNPPDLPVPVIGLGVHPCQTHVEKLFEMIQAECEYLRLYYQASAALSAIRNVV